MCVPERSGFAHPGDLLLPVAAKEGKNACPSIRPRLRRGSLAPSPLQGHATKGRPWPIVALATSMSLNSFHGDSTRPPEGDFGVVCENVPQEQKPNTTDFDLPEMSQARDLVPFRRPSGGVAQGDEPHGCGERLKGPWTALVSRPPERHRKEGSLAAGQTRMSGWPSLWLLSLGRGGHPQARESDSP